MDMLFVKNLVCTSTDTHQTHAPTVILLGAIPWRCQPGGLCPGTLRRADLGRSLARQKLFPLALIRQQSLLSLTLELFFSAYNNAALSIPLYTRRGPRGSPPHVRVSTRALEPTCAHSALQSNIAEHACSNSSIKRCVIASLRCLRAHSSFHLTSQSLPTQHAHGLHHCVCATRKCRWHLVTFLMCTLCLIRFSSASSRHRRKSGCSLATTDISRNRIFSK